MAARQHPDSTVKTEIDWSALLIRQETAFAAASERSLAPDEEQVVLRARAAQLAARPALEQEAGATIDCLQFLLSGESYAVELSYIDETMPLSDFTPLFCTPPFVLGIINLRGKIISIIDLRRFFELPVIGLSDLNRVIVVGNGTMEFGVLADSIVGMRSIPAKELMPPPDAFTGIREEFLAGVTAERVALLDMGKILADPRVTVHEEVA